MNNRPDQRPKIKLAFRPGKTVTKVALLAAIILSTAALVTINSAMAKAAAQEERARDKAAQYEQDIRDTKQDMEQLGSEDSIRDIAKDELGLVDPDTVVIDTGK